jgi:hypothetical protein
MPLSPWANVTVLAMTPGATYEDRTFDQYLQVSAPDGTVVEVFDMAPMVGQGLAPSADVQALIAVDPYSGFAPGGTDGTSVLASSLTLDVGPGVAVRPEVTQRRWAALTYRGALPVLVRDGVVQGLGAGQPVKWQEATFILLGWRSV